MGRALRDELQRLEILERVSFESIEGVIGQCSTRQLDAGETLLRSGQANEKMYMILTGELGVHLESSQSEPVAVLGAGQTVGELSVIDHSPATAHVIARRTSRLLAVDEDAFWRMVTASHDFAKNLLRLLARRMRANNFTIAETTRLRQRFEHESLADALTGLFNRRWLDTRLPRMLQRHCRDGLPLSLLLLDIDRFKHFNDTHGHAAGDCALAEVARALTDNLRPVDWAARYGGEEFVVILPETTLEGAQVAADRLRRKVASLDLSIDGQALPPVTISIGAAQAIVDESANRLLERADAALYRAKETGRDRVERADL